MANGIEYLKKRYQQVLQMRSAPEGEKPLSFAECARIMGVSVARFRELFRTAQRKLAELEKRLQLAEQLRKPIFPYQVVVSAWNGSEDGSNRSGDGGNLDVPVDALGLSGRALNCLLDDPAIRSVRQLLAQSEIDLLERRNLGSTTLFEIKQKLAEAGLQLCT